MNLKSTLVIATTFLILFTQSAFAANTRYIVLGADVSNLKSHVSNQGGAVENDLVYYDGFAAQMSETAVANLRHIFGDTVFIEEDFEVTTDARPGHGGSTTPPVQSTPWGITAVHATEAAAIDTGSNALVCVVDTGIESTHDDLAANIIGGENFVASRGTIKSSNWSDDNGHGTHVAGTVAAINNTVGALGVAPQAALFAVKALDKRGSGYVSAVADGILSCVANGADVINMSLGSSSDSTVLHDAVSYASSQGVILVAAAGNESGAVSYPAKYAEVLAVSAVDSNYDLAYFSNTGSEVDYAAPGVDVYSTYKGNTYATLSGTSMASPHVSGVVALWISSASLGLVATDIGLTIEMQGQGFIDALATVNYR